MFLARTTGILGHCPFYCSEYSLPAVAYYQEFDNIIALSCREPKKTEFTQNSLIVHEEGK